MKQIEISEKDSRRIIECWKCGKWYNQMYKECTSCGVENEDYKSFRTNL